VAAIARQGDRDPAGPGAELEDAVGAAAAGQLAIEGDVGAPPTVLVVVQRGVGVMLARPGVDQILDEAVRKPGRAVGAGRAAWVARWGHGGPGPV
jgi:hypothetical protein